MATREFSVAPDGALDDDRLPAEARFEPLLERPTDREILRERIRDYATVSRIML